MEQCCLCQISFNSPDLKGKGKEKIYTGRSCAKERDILEKFVENLNLSRLLLPSKGKLCYSCIHNLKNWEKKVAEVSSIQEKLKLFLQQSTRRNKRTLSEAEIEESQEFHQQKSVVTPAVLQSESSNGMDRMETEENATNADESSDVEVDVSINKGFCICPL